VVGLALLLCAKASSVSKDKNVRKSTWERLLHRGHESQSTNQRAMLAVDISRRTKPQLHRAGKVFGI
jgi:hypothetical protein